MARTTTIKWRDRLGAGNYGVPPERVGKSTPFALKNYFLGPMYLLTVVGHTC